MTNAALVHALLETHMDDIAKARALIRDAIDACGEDWLPCHTVVEALAIELADHARRNGLAAQVAAYLHAVAASIEAVPSQTSS